MNAAVGNKYEKWSNFITNGFILRVYRHSDFGGKALLTIKETVLKRKVYKDYKYLFDRYQMEGPGEMIDANTPVWVFWWQGEEQMPVMVKACISRIRKAFPNRKMVMITKDNYEGYVNIGEGILRKQREGKISITTFSDILRMNLLTKYGGIWCDATLWIDGKIDFDMSDRGFYTLKHIPNKPQVKMEPSRAYWRIFFMASGKGNIITSCCKDFYEAYFDSNDTAFDYFLTDYIIRMCYEHIPLVKDMLDGVPEIEPIIYDLYDKLNLPYNEEEYSNLMGKYPIQKLNRRGEFSTVTTEGEETFYGRLFK